jgi:hypothetical protein
VSNAFDSDSDETEDRLIDLDSFGSFQRFEPDAGSGDTSSLTLHPMFFDQESPDLPGLLDARGSDDHDRWNGSGER